MTKITIVYAPDTNFFPLTLVSMASVLQNAPATDSIQFAIIYAGLDEKYLPMIDNLQSIHPFELKLLKVDETAFADFPLANWVTVETWFRCLMGDLLPQTDKALYLDCDTIVRSSLAPLFSLDMKENLMAGVEDISKSKFMAEKLALEDNLYCNAGVIFANLEAWRKADFFNLIKRVITDNSTVSNDQDAINKACDKLKFRLPPQYDFMHTWWFDNIPEYDAEYMKQYEAAGNDAVIVHFIGPKPNTPKCRNKFVDEYKRYTRLIPNFDALQREIGCRKQGRRDLSLKQKIFSITYSNDKRHKLIHLLGFTLKFKC